MRALLSFVPTLAAVALGAAASPAAAQYAVSEAARPAVRRVAPSVRTVASYRLAASRDASLLASVTVADSAGTLVASFRLPGESAKRPLAIMVLGPDLVLQGEAPAGLLTLHLYRQNDGDPTAPVEGRWSLAGQRGELRAPGGR